MRKAVIFDLDQTLVDTSNIEHHRKSGNWNSVYEGIGQLIANKEIDDLIKLLNEGGILIFIVTMSPSTYCQKIIDRFKWNVTGKICYHDVKPLIKPHPESFNRILRDYNLEADNVISAGDSAHDIVASNKANIKSIACCWASKDVDSLLLANPTLTAKSPTDLVSLVKEFHQII